MAKATIASFGKTPEVLQASSVWCYEGSHDKVYSVQLLREGNRYVVASQYGRRDANPRHAPITYDGASQWEAERAYKNLLHSKVFGTKGSRSEYDRTLDKPIIPVEYGGLAVINTSKEDQMKQSKVIKALHDFLAADPDSSNSNVIAEVMPDSGLDALASM